MSAFGGKADIVESHNGQRALLVFRCLTLAPSKECGRCSLAKLGLARFTARLFWRLGEQWHLAVDIFDALPPHTVAAGYMRPIHTRHNAVTLNVHAAKPPGESHVKDRRPCRSALFFGIEF